MQGKNSQGGLKSGGSLLVENEIGQDFLEFTRLIRKSCAKSEPLLVHNTYYIMLRVHVLILQKKILETTSIT